MDIRQAGKIFEIIRTTYPRFANDYNEKGIAVWSSLFGDTPYEEVALGLKNYILTDTSGFPPTIGQINREIVKFKTSNIPSADEAWGLVREAISNGIYGSQEEYAKLPPICQKIVGSPQQIQDWAECTLKELQVARSIFLRSYANALEEDEVVMALPMGVKEQNAKMLEKTNGLVMKMLGKGD